MTYWILYTLIGLIAGFFSGVLGIGGGILIVPSVYFLSIEQGACDLVAMQQAIATSLVVMIFTSMASSLTHIAKKGVLWPIFRWLLIGVIIGCVLGPYIGLQLSTSFLKTVLAVVEIAMGVLLLLRLKKKLKETHIEAQGTSSPFLFIPFGALIGFFASVLGLGGGVITVPTLMLLGHSSTRAVATSALTVLPTSLIASASYLFLAQKAGYTHFYEILNIPAFISLTIGTLIATPLGALCCYKIPQKPLKVVFAALLVTLGILFFI